MLLGSERMGKKKDGNKKKEISGRNWRPAALWAAVGVLVIIGVALLLMKGCGANNNEGDQYMNETKPVVTIEMESGGVIKLELDPENAPNTVKNFIALAEQGYYDGLIFHRVIPGFMIQGGCPQGSGMGGPGYNIKGEFSANGHDNTLTHNRGVISMARSRGMDTAGSQFFITVDAAPHLNGQYAAFGTVTEGMDEVDRIVSVERDRSDKPLEPQKIKSITVETFGVAYEPPDKL